MIVDYELTDKYKPSDRQVWLMSKRAEECGYKVDAKMMRSMERGELKFYDGKFYKLCRHCLDYLELDKFYSNQRYVMGVGYICKDCSATRRRIKRYGVASFVSDTGIKQEMDNVKLKLSEDNKKIIERKLMEDGHSQKEDS